MDEPTILDKAFHVIMKRMVETGQAPFYTELASSLGLAVEEGAERPFTTFSAQASPAGCIQGPTTSSPLHPSTTSPPITASPSTAGRNGSASEDSNRWRSAGSSLAKR